MDIQYLENELTPQDVLKLKESVGWGEHLAQIEKGLQNGLFNIVVKAGNESIAMGRLVGDGAKYWYMQDIVIHPQWQGKGIGTQIINKLLTYIQANSIKGTSVWVGLTAAKGKEAFYEQFQFVACPHEDSGAGMQLRIHI